MKDNFQILKRSIMFMILLTFMSIDVMAQVFTSNSMAPFNNPYFFSRVIDFDNDGDEDIIGWNYQVAQSALLYENNGSGVFTDVSLTKNAPVFNDPTFADMDKNGWMDVCFFYGDTLLIYFNQNGVFQTPSAGCGKIQVSPLFGSTNLRSLKLGDINGDGIYDMIAHVLSGSTSVVKVKYGSWSCGTCGYSMNSAPSQSLITLNNAIDPLLSLADVNNDGSFDLLIANGTQSSPYASGYWNFSYSVYLNNGTGSFSLMSGSGFGLGRSSAFGSLGELNNDGRVDIFSGAADCCVGGNGGGGNINPLYTFLSNGSGGYNSSTTAMTRAADRKYYNSATVLDINFDGKQDVVWTDIYAYAFSSSALQCYLNNGNGTLTESSASMGIQLGTSSSPVLHTNQRSVVVDINNDLKPDLNIQSYGTYNNVFHNNYTMMNNSTNKVVKLKLDACTGLKEGIGARVRYKVAGQWNHLQHTAYASANQPYLYLGMSNASSIDSIEVKWIGGAITVRTNVSANSFIIMQEDEGCLYNQGGVQNVVINDSIVQGSSYLFNGQNITEAGTYTAQFTSLLGCDSLVTLNLSVYQPPFTCNIQTATTTLCEGESVTLSVNTTGGAGATSQLPANLQQGLVAYYPFNGNANDESGNGNNGLVNGATLTSDRFGNLGSAYGFDGVNDLISVPSSSGLNTMPMSLSFWVKTTNLSNAVFLKKYCCATWNGFSLEVYNPLQPALECAYYLSTCQGIYQTYCSPVPFITNSTSSLLNGNWHQIVFVVDASGGKVYLDGEVIHVQSWYQSSTPNNGIAASQTSTQPLSIGGHLESSRFLNGSLDDIIMYNRALSPSEIQQLYTAQTYAWSTNETTPTITVTPTQNTTYTATVTQGNQTCTASIDITVNPNVTSAISATIIQGETYTLGTQTLTTAGTYTEVFTSASGCDSTVTLTLSVEPLLTCEITATNNTLCEEESTQLSVSFNSSIFDPLQLSLDFNATYIGAYNGKHYFISNEAFSWLGARQHALSFQNYNLDLAVFETLDENDAVDQLSSSYNEFLWIGLYQNYNSPSYSEPSGGWSWVNGSDIDYWNFEIQEPSNGNALSVNTQEDYGHLKRYPNGKWNDYSGGSLTKAIFELSDLSLSSVSISWSTLEMSPNILVTPTVTTTYTATVTTATQTCTDSITITVNPLLTWYADADADGFGNPDDVVQDCNQPQGYTADNTDCNDEDAAAYPGASEICDNNRDEDCNGLDSLCFVPVLGCTEINACNFNPEANTDDGSCILPQPETCNGLDDNCNGQVDEGLTPASIIAVSVVTDIYPVCVGNSIRSANLNNGANSAVIEGNGNDLWYSFTAQFNTFRAGLSAATGDNDVRLYTMSAGGCLELVETEHEITTGNQTLLSDQLTVGQTYYVAVHNISGSMNPSAKICFNHLLGSTCDHYYSNNTGVYTSVCNSFKAQYRANAVAYTFDILSATQNNVNQNITPWSYTTTSASTVVARLGTLLPANQGTSPIVYTLKVPVLYSLFDAAGNFENLFAQATTTCAITLNAEPTIALRSSDRCPITKSLTSTIAPDRTVCGAMRYDWEFTEVLPNPGTAQVVQGGNYSTAFFLSNVPGITVGKTYSVRVKPVHSSNTAGQWGTAYCLRLGAAGMMNHPGSADAEPPLLSLRAGGEMNASCAIYPNPTSTGSFVLQYNDPRRGELTFAPDATTEPMFMEELVMMDITGKVVFKTNVLLNGNIAEIHFGDLESGLYLVDFGGERMRVQVMK